MEGRGDVAPGKSQERTFASQMFGGDRVLWIILAVLAVMSLLVVYSSTTSLTTQAKHLFFGFLAIWFVHRFNYQVYARFAKLAFIMSLGLMLLTFFVGVKINDSARWLRIPIIGITFQPADFLKVTLVMVLAQQLALRQIMINKMALLPRLFTGRQRNREMNRDIFFDTTLPVLGPVVLVCGTILYSNFSTAAIVFFTCWIMLYIGRVRLGELLRLMGIVMVATVGLLVLMHAAGIGRAETWANRLKDYAGIRTEQVEESASSDSFQVEQAKIAIASGILGKGPGNSTQRVNLPLSYSDFAYAFIVEEYGTMGAMAVLLLYLWIFFRSILIFQKCGTAFPSLLVLGLGLMIVLQAFINMLVSVNLIPVTGQTLPLISLGGSSLLFTSLALGMILGVSRQVAERSLDRPRGESLLEK